MAAIWKVEMLGTFQARQPDLIVSRFRTRRVATLLAYLALNQKRWHFRDELGELLWPDSELEVSRRNLRQALLSLRHAIEPPPLPSGSVVQVNQSRIQLNPEALTTDLAEFEDLIERSKSTANQSDRFELLKQAVSLYKGELLPGFEDVWVLNERLRMEDLYLYALGQLIKECHALGKPEESILYLRLAVAKEPLNEQWHTELMRQYLNLGRAPSALKQYDELTRLLQTELNCDPDEEAQKLASRARKEAGNQGLATPNSTPQLAETDPTEESGQAVTVRLPIQITRVFGRQHEVHSVTERIQNSSIRMVTVLGPAGTGKTRLSIEVGKNLAQTGFWNVWFVPLADIDDASSLLERIIETIQPKKRSRSDLLGQINEAISSENSLLILDNVEHILDRAAPIISDLLQNVPLAKLLITSRQSLKLEGEIEFPLEPLAIPQTSKVETSDQVATLAEVPSIQMLVDRCQAIRPDVQLTLHNARYFAEICAKLEGLPLAIEIAAGLSNSLAPAQMVKHLDNRLSALTSRRRDITPRHRSLRVAIEYGYGFLSPSLQRFFAALSVFRGGFSVGAAHAICHSWQSDSGESSSEEACLSSILDLQERSFLKPEQDAPEGGGLRFRLLEVFREFGEECLSSDEHEELRSRHSQYYLDSSTPENQITSADQRLSQQVRIDSDYDNYVAALDYLFQRRQLESCIRLIGALSTIWDIRGTKQVEQSFIRQLAALPETRSTSPEAQIHLLRMLGTTYLRTSDFKAAYRACNDALRVAQDIRDDSQIASCYYGMALCAGYMGQPEECIDLCRKVLDHAPATNGILLERTYVSIGSAHWTRDELAEAEAAFTQAKEVSEAFRNGEADALIYAHLAGVYLDQGKFDDSMRASGKGILISQRLHNGISLAASLTQVARYHRMRGNMAAALASNHEALLLGRDIAISALALEMLRGHALILCQFGQHATAATLIAATQGMEVAEKTVDVREKALGLNEIQSALTNEDFERAWAKGLAMDLDEAFRLAIRYK